MRASPGVTVTDVAAGAGRRRSCHQSQVPNASTMALVTSDTVRWGEIAASETAASSARWPQPSGLNMWPARRRGPRCR